MTLINGYILYPEQYLLIWKTSFLILFVSMYSIYKEQYDVGFIQGVIFCTSINYWRKPNYSWRRYIDMICVKFGLCYHMMRAYNIQYYKLYYSVTLIGVILYPLGIYYYNKKLYWLSTYTHCALHVFGNLSSVILSSQIIEPINYCILYPNLFYYVCQKRLLDYEL